MGTIKWVVENVILCRWQCFKNEPRGQTLVVRAVLIPIFSLTFINVLGFLFSGVILTLIMGGDPKAAAGPIFNNVCKYFAAEYLFKLFVGYLGAVSLVYWNSNNSFKRSWQYCANLYSQICLKSKYIEQWDCMRSALAIDLLIHDFWAQRAFQDFFSSAMKKALKSLPEEECIKYTNKLIQNQLTENEALEVLEKYNIMLVEKLTRKLTELNEKQNND